MPHHNHDRRLEREKRSKKTEDKRKRGDLTCPTVFRRLFRTDDKAVYVRLYALLCPLSLPHIAFIPNFVVSDRRSRIVYLPESRAPIVGGLITVFQLEELQDLSLQIGSTLQVGFGSITPFCLWVVFEGLLHQVLSCRLGVLRFMDTYIGNKFRLGRKIGSGSFGEIHLGTKNLLFL